MIEETATEHLAITIRETIVDLKILRIGLLLGPEFKTENPGSSLIEEMRFRTVDTMVLIRQVEILKEGTGEAPIGHEVVTVPSTAAQADSSTKVGNRVHPETLIYGLSSLVIKLRRAEGTEMRNLEKFVG
jgi:hypothetical protein